MNAASPVPEPGISHRRVLVACTVIACAVGAAPLVASELLGMQSHQLTAGSVSKGGHAGQAVPGGPTSVHRSGGQANGVVQTSSVNPTTYRDEVLADHPAIYYRVNESSGTTAVDSSGNANDGTYTSSGVTFSTAGALIGDSDSAVTTASSANITRGPGFLPLQTAFTLEVWIRTTSMATSEVIGFNNSMFNSNTEFDMDLGQSGGAPVLCFVGSSAPCIFLPQPYWDGNWHMFDVMCCYSAYMDGQFAGSAGGSTGNPINTVPTLVVGANPGGINQGLAGDYDEVAVYPNQLSPQRIAAHWTHSASASSAGCNVPPSTPYQSAVLQDSPVAYYRLGETPPGRVAFDGSGNCTGIAPTNATYSYGITSQSAGALVGEGDGAVTMTASSTLTRSPDFLPVQTAFTLEVWVRTTSTAASDVISFNRSTSNTEFDMELGQSGGAPVLCFVGSSAPCLFLPQPYSDGNWHMFDVMCCFSAYMDGQFVGSVSGSTGNPMDTAPTLVVGSNFGGLRQGVLGDVDEVAVYPTQLSPQRIDAHWTQSAFGATTACKAPPASAYSSVVLQDSPVAYYRLGETPPGRVAFDGSGNCTGFAPTNATYSYGITSQSPGALVGDSDGAVTMTASSTLTRSPDFLPVQTAFTLEVWVRTTSTAASDVIAFNDSASQTEFDMELGQSGGSPVLCFVHSSAPCMFLPKPYSDGNWHMFDVMCCFSAYMDGQFVGSVSGSTGNPINTVPMLVVGSNFGGLRNGLPGDFDEVAVYPTQLSPQRIAAHYVYSGQAGPVGGAASGTETSACSNPSEPGTSASQGSGGDPCNTASGSFSDTTTDLSIPGRGLPLAFTRTYSSTNAAANGPLGYGWTYNGVMSLRSDPSSGVVTIHQENGSTVVFTPISGGYLTPPRVIATLTLNPDGTYTFVREAKDTFTFSPAGELISSKDLNGYTTSYAYNGSGQLASMTDTAGRHLTFAYSGANLVSVTYPAGRAVAFSYDANGNLAQVTDVGGGVTAFTYDANHLLLTKTDPRGGTLTNSYDSSGRVVSQTDAMGRKTTFAYSGNYLSGAGGSTTITDPLGNVTVEQYFYGERLSVTRAQGTAVAATTSYTYDPATLQVTARTDPNGHVTRSTYDASGNLLSRTDPLGRSTTYSYNSLDEALTVTDGNGVTTTMIYDSRGNLVSTATPASPTQTATTANHYDDPGHPGDVTSKTDANGATRSYSYDLDGDPTAATDPLGRTTTYQYDAIGRQSSQTSPSGRTTRYQYDAFGDLTSGTDPLGHTTTYSYDGDHNNTGLTDAEGRVTAYAYDADSEQTMITRADGTTLRTSYDANSNVLQQIDSAGQATTYTYDALNRQASARDPLGRVTSYTYDLAGNQLSLTDPQGRVTRWSYDAGDEVTGINYSDGTTPNVSGIPYDGDGHRLHMSDGLGMSAWTYDSLGRMTSSSMPDRAGLVPTVTYEYDLNGNLTALTYPGGHRATHALDAAGEVTGISDWLGHTTAFTYDADGELTQQCYPNGIGGTTTYDATAHVAQISYANCTPSASIPEFLPGEGIAALAILGVVLIVAPWRSRRQRSVAGGLIVVLIVGVVGQAATTQTASAQTLPFAMQFNYTRNADTLVTSETDTLPGDVLHNYSYTTLNQLSQDNLTPYQYSSADNVTELPVTTANANPPAPPATLTYDNANELQSMNSNVTTESFTYNAEGDRTQVAGSGLGYSATYAYDEANRLTSFNSTAMYAYNGDGLRMSKTVGGSGEPFIWDVSGSLPTLIADGATSYLMGPNGLPIEQISSAGTVLYYLPDQLGSTRGLVDPTGALVGQFTYDAYGRLVNAVGTVTNPVFGFAGQFVDSESGLYYMRARYYDPATGQLISIDPMAGSTRTPYSYVGGDPVNFVDPTGLYTGKQVRKAAEEMRRILEGFSSITNLLSLTCSAIEVSLAGGAAGAGPEGEAVVAPEEGAIWAACSQVLGDLSLAADVLKTGTAVASCQNGGNCGQILVDVIGLLVSGSQAHFHDLRGLGKPGKLISDAIHSTINSAFGWLGTLAVHYSCPSA